jgi:hypothetical protein
MICVGFDDNTLQKQPKQFILEFGGLLFPSQAQVDQKGFYGRDLSRGEHPPHWRVVFVRQGGDTLHTLVDLIEDDCHLRLCTCQGEVMLQRLHLLLEVGEFPLPTVRLLPGSVVFRLDLC